MTTAIIAAAGQGRRMGAEQNKVLLPLCGRTVLAHSAMAIAACPEVDRFVIVAAPHEASAVEGIFRSLAFSQPFAVVHGGAERQHSIHNALKTLPDTECFVLVHDAARPLLESATVGAVLAAARKYRAAAVGVPMKDTVKIVDSAGFVTATPDRETLWNVQTPQAFAADILRQAYRQAEADGFLGTDDAGLVERIGVQVRMVRGQYRNFKLTTPEDMEIAGLLLRKGRETGMMRFGIGYDVHCLTPGRKLILGGVDIPFALGLEGHSDADVLLHAVKDALLGAAGLGDIGRHFPSNDNRYKGISSLILLAEVRELLDAHGWRVNNLDAVVVAEKPRLAPFVPTMAENIAATLAVSASLVNIKATTTEGLGFAGRQEGIAAYAVASIVQV